MQCDVTVAALVMDTVEAVSTYGVKSRFYCKADSEASRLKAGCVLCHTPTFYYNEKASALSSAHAMRRSSAAMESIRTKTADDRDRAGT